MKIKELIYIITLIIVIIYANNIHEPCFDKTFQEVGSICNNYIKEIYFTQDEEQCSRKCFLAGRLCAGFCMTGEHKCILYKLKYLGSGTYIARHRTYIRIEHDQLTAKLSEEICQNKNAYLVAPSGEDDLNFIKEREWFYIGVNDTENEGNFVRSVDGMPAYLNWATWPDNMNIPDEPNGSTDQNCVFISEDLKAIDFTCDVVLSWKGKAVYAVYCQWPSPGACDSPYGSHELEGQRCYLKNTLITNQENSNGETQ